MKTEGGNVWAKWVGPVVLALFLASCASERLDMKKFQRDGVQYGQTEGTFRGRWWNYYERGRSLLEGGFYEQAMSDLDAALKGRARDQYWPRTYGLHFAKEYFPHREMGIAYYFTRDFARAQQELEQGYAQQPSARGAYYLNKVNRERVMLAGGDQSPPSIRLITPTTSALGEIRLTLEAEATDDQFVAEILINGERIESRYGLAEPVIRFTHEVTLGPGENSFEVAVTDLAGKTTTETFAIAADHDGPIVSFDTPVSVPGRVTGQLWDAAGVGAFDVAGIAVERTEGADGIVNFAVDLPADKLQPPLTYRCEDSLGNATSGKLVVDRVDVAAMMGDIRFASMPSDWPMPENVRPVYRFGQLAQLERVEDVTNEVNVNITGVRDQQQVFRDEIVVGLDVNASNPISQIDFNGESIPIIPARKRVSTTRKLAFREMGEETLNAEATDSQGTVGRQSMTVERVANDLELEDNNLKIAFIDEDTQGTNPGVIDLEQLYGELRGRPGMEDRFTFVDRRRMPDILTELQLTELSSASDRLQLGRIIPAEIFFVVRARADEESVEVVLERTDAVTGEYMGEQIAIAGGKEESERIVEWLAVRLLQEFPIVRGLIAWSPPRHMLSYSTAQGIQANFRFFVVKDEADPFGSGTFPKKIGEGFIESVGDVRSFGQVLTIDLPDVTPEQIDRNNGYYVVTK